MSLKICKCCREAKALDHFYKNGPIYHKSACIDCTKISRKQKKHDYEEIINQTKNLLEQGFTFKVIAQKTNVDVKKLYYLRRHKHF